MASIFLILCAIVVFNFALDLFAAIAREKLNKK